MTFDAHLAAWHLKRDSATIHTASSDLQPVRMSDGRAAMLKRARAPEERAGAALMSWWQGDGAAEVYARDADVILIERALDGRDLLVQALRDPEGDAEASLFLCDVLARLHAPRASSPPPLQPINEWFAALHREAARHGGILTECAAVADRLLADPIDVVPLHGDCHHRNVLHFGARGWLAIDPKDRFGERGFDFAQILCNPDLTHAAEPARFETQLAVVAEAAGIDATRLARWTAARAALSACWFMEDGNEAGIRHDLAIARTVLDWLDQRAG